MNNKRHLRFASGKRVSMHVLGAARTDARVLRAAAALCEDGWLVTIVDTDENQLRPLSEQLDAIRFKHVRTPRWLLNTRFKPWLLTKMVWMLVRRTLALMLSSADVYHAHDANALTACYIAARLRRKMLIFDAHELPLCEPYYRQRPLLRRVAELLLRALLPYCRGVITVSSPIADEIQRLYGGTTAVVVRNMPAYRPPIPSDRLRQRLGLASHVRIALYQGNLTEDRGLDLVVAASRYMGSDITIVMLGDGPCRPHLEAAIAQEGVSDLVKLLPAVSYEELLDWTASADLGLVLLPPNYSLSIMLSLPNKLFEYLMAGLPVLTSPLPAVVDVLDTHHAGRTVFSVDPESIGQAITAMLCDREGLAAMRANALAASANELRWDVESRRLLGLYQQVLIT